MWKLIKFLITGEWEPTCAHEWENYKEINVYDADGDRSMPMYTKYILRCKHCGTFKKFKS